ncbi:MAG: ribosome maturation factor RimP [Bacteroidota bacterium]
MPASSSQTDTPATAARSGSPAEARVRRLAGDVLSSRSDLYLVEVVVKGRVGQQTVEVFVEGDGPVTIDDYARISRELAFLLDAEDVMPGAYRLNVSSPGVKRPLVLPRQYKKQIGRPMKVRMQDADGAYRSVIGTLTGVAETEYTLDIDGEPQTISFEQTEKAIVQLPW